jgi:L-threonylcarbamoyladenylate synthase
MLLSLDEATIILKNGGVVAFPTETVYGLGAIAENQIAVEKVYQIKNRPKDTPLICHFYSIDQIEEFVPNTPNLPKKLLEHFTPGPLSLLLNLPTNSPLKPATAGLPSVIVRIPNHPLTLELIRRVNKPLVGPSANTSGKFSGTNPQMIENDLGDKIAGILDGGRAKIGVESTILDCREPELLKILRQGAIGLVELKNFLEEYELDVEIGFVQKPSVSQTIPGNKYRHYSPRTPIRLIKSIEEIPPNGNFALISSEEVLQKLNPVPYPTISLGHTLSEIGQNLYQSFFELDQLQVNLGYIIFESGLDSSLSKAIQDKINKAAKPDL